MKTRILYILVSDPEDFYAEQLFISVLSLRKNSPGAFVSVLTDKTTKNSLPNRGSLGPRLLETVDEWIVAPIDVSKPKNLRSRLVKTGMRSYVSGDFLFIDADTIIANQLDSIDSCPAELALCLDHHCSFQDIPEKNDIIATCRRIGFDISGNDYYYNSGIILAKDTPKVHELFNCWQTYYISGYNNGVKTDQHSLAQAIADCSIPVNHLEGKWNCQLPFGVKYMRDALVFHYFGSSSPNQGHPLFLLNDVRLLTQLRFCDDLPREINDIIDNFCCGISEVTQLAYGNDLVFWTTRRYRDLKRRFTPGTFSLLEFFLKIIARLPFAKYSSVK